MKNLSFIQNRKEHTLQVFLFISIAIFICINILLFLKIVNLSVITSAGEPVIKSTYTYVIILLCLGIIIFIISQYYLKLAHQYKTKYHEYLNTLSHNESASQKNSHQESKENQTDIQNNNGESHEQQIDKIINKIIPQNTTKETLEEFGNQLLINISKQYELVIGLIHARKPEDEEFHVVSRYAYYTEELPKPFKEGETIPGQVAKDKTTLHISDLPDNYVTVISGLGNSNPKHMLFVPIIYNDKTIGIIELGAFKAYESYDKKVYKHLSSAIRDSFYSLLEKNR